MTISLTKYVCEGSTAKVIADSISQYGVRIITLQLRYPRFIHAEFMTHRVFSRNARSSRAVPVSKLLQEGPYLPHFMKNQKGMQSFEELDERRRRQAEIAWLDLSDDCKKVARELGEYEVHKQWANRMLEWFGYIDVVVTSTRWANFFALRDHPMAMPEIQHLATAMADSIKASIPVTRSSSWHLPYITDEERLEVADDDVLCLLSTARCARVSYAPFDNDGVINREADIALAQRLIGSEPLHASPAEHQAYPDMLLRHGMPRDPMYQWACPEKHGNFFGWIQHRKMHDNEAAVDINHTIEECLNYQDLRERQS